MPNVYQGGRRSAKSRARPGGSTSFRRHARLETSFRQRWRAQQRLAQFDQALREALPLAIAGDAPRELAERLGNNRNTVFGWQQAWHLPHLVEAFVLADEVPAVKAIFLRLLKAEHGPAAERLQDQGVEPKLTGDTGR